MSVVKDFRFPVSVELVTGRLTRLSAVDKVDLHVATPPEFHGGLPGIWSPEELLVGAAASCYAVTLVAVAERSDVEVRDLTVRGTGHVTRRLDGKIGFVSLELHASFATDPQTELKARRVARKAKDVCIVTLALEVPVHLTLDVRAAELEEAIA